MTFATSPDWLAHPGTVGRAVSGTVHIMAEDNETELAIGEEGGVYFEGEGSFEYHDDPEKTKASRNSKGWTTLGDVGKLDEDGFLYLTDRKDFMIISGGVNIYPQAIEDALILHPKVMDVAVIGQENSEYGEQVLAVVQPKNWADVASGLEGELRAWCADKISPVTQPRAYQFIAELPRLESGKNAKHALKAVISGS